MAAALLLTGGPTSWLEDAQEEDPESAALKLTLWAGAGATGVGTTFRRGCLEAVGASTLATNASSRFTFVTGVGASLRCFGALPLPGAFSAGCRGAWLTMRMSAPAGTCGPLCHELLSLKTVR